MSYLKVYQTTKQNKILNFNHDSDFQLQNLFTLNLCVIRIIYKSQSVKWKLSRICVIELLTNINLRVSFFTETALTKLTYSFQTLYYYFPAIVPGTDILPETFMHFNVNLVSVKHLRDPSIFI